MKIIAIESSQNENFKLWKSLRDSRGLKKQGLFLLSGRKLVPEYAQSSLQMVHAYIIPRNKSFKKINAPTFELSPSLFKELDEFGTNSPLLVCEMPKIEVYHFNEKKADSKDELEVFLALSDPSNLGAALRSCLAFNAKKVVLLKECASPFLPKALRASSGAVFSLNIQQGPSINRLPQDSDFLKTLVALDKKGEDISKYSWPRPTRLLLGEEGKGLPEDLKSQAQLVSINMNPKLESLNAVQALSVAMYEKGRSRYADTFCDRVQ